MQADFIEYLICPSCKSDDLTLKNAKSTFEVRSGNIVCNSCDNKMAINNGVIMSMKNPSEEVLKEQVGAEEHLRGVLDRISAYSPEIKEDHTADPYFYELPKQLHKGIVYNRRKLALFEHAVERANLEKGALVLDVGAGCCWTAYRLALKGYKPVATDIIIPPHIGLESHDLFHEQKGVVFERIFHDGNNALPIKKESFDAILLCAALHHIVNLKDFAKNCHSMLKPGGKLVAFREPLCGFWENDSREHTQLRKELGSQELARTWYDYREPFLQTGYNVSTYFCDSYEKGVVQSYTEIDSQYPAFDIMKNHFSTRKEKILFKLLKFKPINKLFHDYFARLVATIFGNSDRFRRFDFCLIATKK